MKGLFQLSTYQISIPWPQPASVNTPEPSYSATRTVVAFAGLFHNVDADELYLAPGVPLTLQLLRPSTTLLLQYRTDCM
jgi:hypothetical protein